MRKLEAIYEVTRPITDDDLFIGNPTYVGIILQLSKNVLSFFGEDSEPIIIFPREQNPNFQNSFADIKKRSGELVITILMNLNSRHQLSSEKIIFLNKKNKQKD